MRLGICQAWSLREPPFQRQALLKAQRHVSARPHLLHNVFGFLGDPTRIVWCVRSDGLEELILVITMEGGLADKHLIEEDPKRPPVHGERVLQAL